MNRLRVQDDVVDEVSDLEEKSGYIEKQIEVLGSNELELTPEATTEVEAFEWSEFRRGIFEPQVWICGLASMTSVVGLNSLSFFL